MTAAIWTKAEICKMALVASIEGRVLDLMQHDLSSRDVRDTIRNRHARVVRMATATPIDIYKAEVGHSGCDSKRAIYTSTRRVDEAVQMARAQDRHGYILSPRESNRQVESSTR